MLSQRVRERRTSNTFYSQVLLSRQGPLAKVWLAAHWFKKLRKSDALECNLETAVARIIAPQAKIALRTYGHLLLGIVRIYSRKVKYLLADCQKAYISVNVTFRAELIDLPRQQFEAQYDSITLREEFHDFEFENINELDVLECLSHHQSRPEEITLKEDYDCVLYFKADSFGGNPETLRSHSLIDDNKLLNSSLLTVENSSESQLQQKSFIWDFGDGFGDEGNAETMIDKLLQGYQSDLLEEINFNVKVSLTAGSPNITVVEPANPEDEFIPITDIVDEVSSIEEQGCTLEPIVMPAITEKKKSKRKKKVRDQDTTISKKEMLKRISSFENTPAHLRFLMPKGRLVVLNKTQTPKTLLSTPCQYLIHDDLKNLFASFRQPSRLKRETSVQKVPVKEKVKNRKKEILKRKSTNTQEELNQPQIKKHVTDVNIDPFHCIEQNLQPSEKKEANTSNQRAHQILKTLRESNKKGKESFSLKELCKNSNRKQAAAAFYSLLVLRKEQAIEVSQSAPYEDIIATVGPRFHDL